MRSSHQLSSDVVGRDTFVVGRPEARTPNKPSLKSLYEPLGIPRKNFSRRVERMKETRMTAAEVVAAMYEGIGRSDTVAPLCPKCHNPKDAKAKEGRTRKGWKW